MHLPLVIMDAQLPDAAALFPARVVSAHRHVINLAPKAAPEQLFALTDVSVPRAPRQLRCPQLPVLADDTVHADFDPHTPRFDCRLRLPQGRLQKSAVHAAWQALLDAASPAPQGFASAVQKRLQSGIAAVLHALDHGQTAPVDVLLGLGQGLTPSGDDFFCGLLIALALPDSPYHAQVGALRGAVLAALHRTHAVSAAFLRDAAQGQVSETVQAFLDALYGQGALSPALAALTALGHRSGHDVLSGLLAGLSSPQNRSTTLCPYIAD